MKKIVYSLLFALCLPIGLMAQSVDDDLYFVPSKEKEKKETPVKKEVRTNIYTAPGTTVVIRDRNGNTRDVDEYNRRYESRDNDFTVENDTLYIREKKRRELEGEWVTGRFDGTRDDYEYAERIIRFRNPRFAISISSPLYWEVVYGSNSWDWNVYTDGLYAYAFPTFSNPLWWDWRYRSYSWNWNYGWGWGWNYGWGYPYYSWRYPYYSWGYYPGYWGGWYDSYWSYHHYYDYGWYGGNYYRGRSLYNANSRSRYSNGRSFYYSGRSGDVRSSRYSRSGMESTRRGSSTYTRPSSTRGYSPAAGTESRSSRSNVGTTGRDRGPSYSRGSSSSSSRSSSSSYSRESSRESSRRSSSYNESSYNRSSGNSSYSSGSSSRSSSSSSGSSYSGNSSGSSSRSSGSSSGGSLRSTRR